MAFSYETDFIHHGGRKHSLCSNSMSYISQDESGCPGKQTWVKGMEQMLACEGTHNSSLVVPGMAWHLTLKCHRRQLRTTLELTAAWPLVNLTLVSRRCCHFSRTRWRNQLHHLPHYFCRPWSGCNHHSTVFELLTLQNGEMEIAL